MAKIAAVASAKTGLRRARVFLDTNVLLYCDDALNAPKQSVALNLVLNHLSLSTGVISIQVLQEYFVNAIRKLGVDFAVARRKVEAYSRFDVVEPNAADILAAIDLHRSRQLSYWDASIIHCAQKAGCKVVLSEDMNHGQIIDGVRIVNPFI